MPKRIPLERKIALLQLIKEKKAVLFGQFSDKLTHQQKKSAWEEVLLKAKSLEIVNATRDANYVRDIIYGVWRARALEKRDKKGKTGSEGGPKINEMDFLILEIIGKESAVVNGLPIGETGDFVPCAAIEVDVGDDITECTDENGGGVNVVPQSVSPTPSTAAQSTPRRAPKRCKKDDVDERRVLQCELMRVKIYKHTLEALKLEKELGLSPSEFTSKFTG